MEKVYGPDTWLVGTRQIRFERDGSFVVDRRGGLSADGVGARGRYRLEGELLTVGVYRSGGCQASTTRSRARSKRYSTPTPGLSCASGNPSGSERCRSRSHGRCHVARFGGLFYALRILTAQALS